MADHVHDPTQFVAGPASFYWMPFDRTRDLLVFNDTTQLPDELDEDAVYMNDTTTACTVTPVTVKRQRSTQQHGLVSNKISSQTVTVGTSFAGIDEDKLAAFWHSEVVADAVNGGLIIQPSGVVSYRTLVVDGPSTELKDASGNGTGKFYRDRLIVPKMFNDGETPLVWDSENDTVLDVVLTGVAPDSVGNFKPFWIKRGFIEEPVTGP